MLTSIDTMHQPFNSVPNGLAQQRWPPPSPNLFIVPLAHKIVLLVVFSLRNALAFPPYYLPLFPGPQGIAQFFHYAIHAIIILPYRDAQRPGTNPTL